MPRLTQSNPKYRKHRASGQAVVTLDGADRYLGPHGTAASRREYDRLIGEWLANGRRLSRGGRAGPDDLTVVELAARFWQHAKAYYRTPGGHGGELGSFKMALAHLRRLYSRSDVRDFGPLALKSVRGSMVESGWSRRYVNRQVEKIRRVFRWGVEQELVPVGVYDALRAVTGLRRGKTDAPEGAPVKPVPEEHVAAVLHHVSRQVKSMIELQQLTGMRAGEVVIMRTCDVDTFGKVWQYRPSRHKTQNREEEGHERIVYVGPKAQRVLGPWLRPNLLEYLFSPAEADADRRAERHAARTTPMSCGNVPGSNRRRRPGRKPKDRYTVDSYRRAIAAGCEIAFGMPAELREPRTAKQRQERAGEDAQKRRKARAAWNAAHVWSPGQLRHTAGTRLRRDFGLEAAQVVLGHKTLTVTQVYAEKNVAAAQKIMGEVG